MPSLHILLLAKMVVPSEVIESEALSVYRGRGIRLVAWQLYLYNKEREAEPLKVNKSWAGTMVQWLTALPEDLGWLGS